MVKTIVKIAVVFLVLLGLLGAVAPSLLTGQVVGLQPGATLYIVQSAMQGKPFFEVFAKDNLLLFIGPTSGGYGWVTLARDISCYRVADALTGAGGNYANGMTTQEFVDQLIATGWSKLPYREAKLVLEGSGIAGGVTWICAAVRRWAIAYLTNKGVAK